MPDWSKVTTDADEGGRHRALVLAEELYEAGQWDGQSAIYFPDPYVAHRLVACGRTAALLSAGVDYVIGGADPAWR
jgi:hypothetical protein